MQQCLWERREQRAETDTMRKTIFTAVSVAIALSALPILAQQTHPATDKRTQAKRGRPMMGCCMGGMCRGWMEGMMMGGAMPPAPDLTYVPEADSGGAKLVNQYCTQCHGLPTPQQHTAEGWPPVVLRMHTRMQWMHTHSTMPIRAPTQADLQTIVAYLQQHATKP